ncbi:type B DNA-directed DNA polymerase [Halomicrobium salinisoli]|uniref:type B DNA-directed DNA polymerase n=1 Tax=Halomicrobium salinisoli TaxID=2878391 RepID=UPI001CEFCEFF|nr:type B DNA-directed DNA polymerase [Halomicrobium salinisoli]
MVVAVDVRDDAVRLWSRTAEGIVCERDRDYSPTCYVDGPDDALADLRARLDDDTKVVRTAFDRKYVSLRDDERSRVLAVDLDRPSEVATFAREVRTTREPQEWSPGTFRLYNVDLSPKFRYCLETDTEPTPAGEEGGEHWPRSLSLSLPTQDLADGDLSALQCGGEPLAADGCGRDEAALSALRERLTGHDPDVLVLSSAALVPLLHDRADDLGMDFGLGRLPGYRRLAGENTYESYGRVGHSPARYDVPGRAIVDRSNSFFWGEGGLPGLFDLVERSGKPLQEAAWASIGTVFTAMQIREAHRRDVLVPWRAWEPESFTTARTLHDADRGGFTFEPEVGLHEDVVEIDFASLYPRIMCEHDLSPETVRCDCHDGDDVPGLGYSVCPDVDDPFVPSVLWPIIEDRAALKDERRRADDPERIERLDAKISALKWILVTCFGYQGYRNSKFGRIEVHESINAHARELLLDAKAELERAGWRVVHGIVDSLWVTPREDDRRESSERASGDSREPRDGREDADSIEDVCARVTEQTAIPLEHESDFEWVCFVPTSDGRRGSLTTYFGRRSDGEGDEDRYKFRGIEARQRSAPAFVADVQEELVATLDEHRDPEAVADRLARAVARLQAGDVDPSELVIRTRASRSLDEYDQRTRTVAALERYRDRGVERHPGQDVRYVVVDDDRRDRDRVRLPWEDPDRYDADFYETLLVRAAESVVSPLGWDRSRIRRYLADGRDLRLSAFS